MSEQGGKRTTARKHIHADPGSGHLSDAQLRYLRSGLDQPGGKLPLFDDEGREFNARTIQSCVDRGWAEPWFANPVKPGWLVCKLTDAGRALLAGGK